MQHYVDLNFQETDDPVFLFEKTFQAFHSFLSYELGEEAARRQSRFAVAFPGHRQWLIKPKKGGAVEPVIPVDVLPSSLVGSGGGGFTNVLRVFASETDLKKMLRYPSMLRYTAMMDSPIKSVPNVERWIRYYRHRQYDRTSPSALRRDEKRGRQCYEKRHRPIVPYLNISLSSDSSRREFRMQIAYDCSIIMEAVGSSVFNAYGLAVSGGVADF